MRDDYRFATALEVAAAIRSRQVSPVEVLDAILARVDALNDQLVAIVWRNDDEARKAAHAAADAVVHTDPVELPPFHGVPIPIKDLTSVAGWPVTYGSWAAPDRPSEESELIVEAFRRAGFILTGRTNTPEFGLITATENDRYGISRNPWNVDRTPGGSSGGAAAAVAAGPVPGGARHRRGRVDPYSGLVLWAGGAQGQPGAGPLAHQGLGGRRRPSGS